MTTELRLQRATDEWIAAFNAYTVERVRQALALERDLTDDVMDKMRDRVLALSDEVQALRRVTASVGHSVRVDP